MLSEFALIDKYFRRDTPALEGEHEGELGIGDDCALVTVPLGEQLAISADMLVSGRHFFPDLAPYLIGWKSIAVNLSDLAAMGATPRWATLSLALPEDTEEEWLAEFARGFFALADLHGLRLIGGDTTAGPLNISIQIMGSIAPGKALLRSNAKVHDEVWVSGSLGGPLAALDHRLGKLDLGESHYQAAQTKLNQPTPQNKLAVQLREEALVHSAIDISDGLSGDLGHILKASQVGATLQLDDIPKHPSIHHLSSALQAHYVLAGGDEYELCFTAAPDAKLSQWLTAQGCTRIGVITKGQGLSVLDRAGHYIPIPKSWDHFDHS